YDERILQRLTAVALLVVPAHDLDSRRPAEYLYFGSRLLPFAAGNDLGLALGDGGDLALVVDDRHRLVTAFPLDLPVGQHRSILCPQRCLDVRGLADRELERGRIQLDAVYGWGNDRDPGASLMSLAASGDDGLTRTASRDDAVAVDLGS